MFGRKGRVTEVLAATDVRSKLTHSTTVLFCTYRPHERTLNQLPPLSDRGLFVPSLPQLLGTSTVLKLGLH